MRPDVILDDLRRGKRQNYSRSAKTAPRLALAALVAVTLALVAGCTSHATTASWQGDPTKANPLSLTITPADRTSKVPVSAEIGLKVAHGKVKSVALTRSGKTTRLKGTLRDDNTSWVPATPLDYNTKYTANVVATSGDGSQTVTQTASFTTMRQPGKRTDTTVYLESGETYGVALPIVVEFDPPVPAKERATVQRRLFVRSTPNQPGVWSWVSGNQVYYRPPMYWRTGTTLSLRSALGGLPMGNGYYGDQDRSATVKIGSKMTMEINNGTKTMSVYIKDKLARKIPVSLGKSSTPSSSGRLVIMSREYTTIFDTTREMANGYRVQVWYAERLTWGGEFIHAAPWSVGDQGYTNVSHGCTNVSDGNARWLYDRVHVGDPVTVRGTEVTVDPGNGWTAWNEPWSKYIKGSALPVPTALAKARDQFAPPLPKKKKPAPKATPTASVTTSVSPSELAKPSPTPATSGP